MARHIAAVDVDEVIRFGMEFPVDLRCQLLAVASLRIPGKHPIEILPILLYHKRQTIVERGDIEHGNQDQPSAYRVGLQCPAQFHHCCRAEVFTGMNTGSEQYRLSRLCPVDQAEWNGIFSIRPSKISLYFFSWLSCQPTNRPIHSASPLELV